MTHWHSGLAMPGQAVDAPGGLSVYLSRVQATADIDALDGAEVVVWECDEDPRRCLRVDATEEERAAVEWLV